MKRWFAVSFVCFMVVFFASDIVESAGELGSNGGVVSNGTKRVVKSEKNAHERLLIGPDAAGTNIISIPLDLPKGKGGLSPSLKLKYSSEAGQSFVGLGWILELGSIKRVGKRGVPSFDSDDEFSADVDGLLLNLIKPDGKSYYTAVEKSLVRFDKNADGTWIARGKGRKYEFFKKVGSILSDGYSEDENRIREWALTAIEDEKGNRIEYEYTNVDTAYGDYYPDLIVWTKGGVTGLQRAVKFYWRDRSDRHISYKNGKVVIRKLLDHIDIYSKWTGSVDSSVIYKRYQFTYEIEHPSPPPECASCDSASWDDCNECENSCGSNSCYPCSDKTTSNASDKKSNWGSADSRLREIKEMFPESETEGAEPTIEGYKWSFGYTDKIPGFDSMVFNGEDKDFVENRSGTPTYIDKGRRLADVNGDGCLDIVRSTLDCKGNELENEVLINNCHGFFTQVDWHVPAAFVVPKDCSDGKKYRNLGTAMVDINGDGLADVVVARKKCNGTALHEIYLNTGNGWEQTKNPTWSDNFPSDAFFVKDVCSDGKLKAVRDYGLRFVNLNGDQYPDILQFSHFKSTARFIAFNMAYESPGMWDRHTDGLGKVPSPAAESHSGTWPLYSSHRAFVTGDINGDGLDDILYSYVDYKNYNDPSDDLYETHIYFNNAAKSWEYRPELSSYHMPLLFGAKDYNVSTPSRDKQESLDGVVIDFNGDGRADLADNFTFYLNCYTCSGDKWIDTTTEMPGDIIDYSGGYYGSNSDTPWDVGTRFWDINSDGIVDITNFNNLSVCLGDPMQENGDEIWYASTTKTGAAKKQNLLEEMKTPNGAVIHFYYKPSSEFDNSDGGDISRMPVVKHVLTKVETDDGRGNFYTVEYSYEGGLYKPEKAVFYGFKKVIETKSDGSIKETVYHQDDILKGKIKRVILKDGDGRIYKKISYYYTDDYTEEPSCEEGNENIDCEPPYFNPIRMVREYIYDFASEPYYQTALTYDYIFDSDGFLKGKVETFWGFDDGTLNPDFPSGAPDQKTRITKYVHNSDPSKWLLELPAKVRIFQGVVEYSDFDSVDENGKPLWSREYEFIYDDGDGKFNGDEVWDAVPFSGRLIKFIIRGSDGTETSITNEFDSSEMYRLSSVKNHAGVFTELLYDSDGYLSGIKDPLGRIVNYQYALNGKISRAFISDSDIENTRTFDPRHRIKEIHLAGGYVEKIDRIGEGDPASQYIESTIYLDDTKKIIKRFFYDGLKRIYRVAVLGNKGGDIYRDIEYDSIERIKKISLPYFSGDGPSLWREYKYDAAGRPVKIYNPESGGEPTYSSAVYKGDIIEIHREDGSHKKIRFDAYGNIKEVTQFLKEKGTEREITTRYSYDLFNRLIKIEGPGGKILTSIKYDGLGRITEKDDVHLGKWRYRYNNAGLLSSIRDPNGNTRRLFYDDFQRLIKAEYWRHGGNRPSLIYRYYYDRAEDGSYKGSSKGKLVEAVSIENRAVPDPARPGHVNYEEREISRILNVYDDYARLSRVEETILGEKVVTEYLYNDKGFITNIVYNPGTDMEERVEYVYDAAGDLEEIKTFCDECSVPAVSLLSEISYDAYGKIKSEKLGSGVVNTYSYDMDFRGLLSQIKSVIGDTTLLELNFSYDDMGRIVQIFNGVDNLTNVYRYDGLGRLISGGREDSDFSWTYRYDDFGNISRMQGPVGGGE